MKASPPDRTRARIVSAARRAFSGRTEAPTLAEVAHAAGVSRATLHRHFRSREDLLRAAELTPAPDARDRALAAAIELLARAGLAALSMDEVAERARVSRANLYRLFPGKAALFRELVLVYSPLEAIGRTAAELSDEPPEVVMPAIARAAARHLEGRVGLVRSLIFEVSSTSTEGDLGRDLAFDRALTPLIAYVGAQMQAGRLRKIHPLLAIQAFAGPVVFHLLLRPVVEDRLGFQMPLEEAATRLAEVWVAGMRPDPKED